MGPSESSKTWKPRHTADQPFFGVAEPRQHKSPMLAHFVAMTGEFVGTFVSLSMLLLGFDEPLLAVRKILSHKMKTNDAVQMFLFFAFLGHMAVASEAGETGPNGKVSGSTIVNISLCYGFSLLVNAWCFYRISGGLFNPAVTLGLVLTGAVPWMRGLVIFPAQLLGGMCAAALASCIVPEHIDSVQTTLLEGMSIAQGLFLEMLLTALLVFAILMLAVEKHKGTFVAPMGIGLALFLAQLAGVYYTGGSLNPARSFGPAVAAARFHGNHWIYWVGPFLGAFISAGYFHFIKFFRYEEVNPGQDSAGGGFEATVHGYHPEAHPAVALKDSESLHQVLSGSTVSPQAWGGARRSQSQSLSPV